MAYRNNTLDIIFWDVQHGSATYIKTPNGTTIAYDLGTGSLGENGNEFSPLFHLKQKYGLQQLDEVIVTHPDFDHISHILQFNNIYVRTLERPTSIADAEILEKLDLASDAHQKAIFQKYLDICHSYCHPTSPQQDPNRPENNGGVTIQNYHPTPDIKTKRINNHSIVTLVTCAGCRILLTGDNETPSWNELLHNSEFIRNVRGIDVFLAPHHGRESGFSKELLDIIQPRLVIVSDGPLGNTSVTDYYSNRARGWQVNHRLKQFSEDRYCVTTRKDGVILAKIGLKSNGSTNLDISVD